MINDFRPISLLNTSMKIITKLLASRSQTVIISFIQENQYGFIKENQSKTALVGLLSFITNVINKKGKSLF